MKKIILFFFIALSALKINAASVNASFSYRNQINLSSAHAKNFNDDGGKKSRTKNFSKKKLNLKVKHGQEKEKIKSKKTGEVIDIFLKSVLILGLIFITAVIGFLCPVLFVGLL